MANPFYVAPPNILEALQQYDQSYNSARKDFNENQMKAGRLEAAQTLAQGGDVKPVLAKLLQYGDIQGANAVATWANQEATQKFHSATLGENTRHNKRVEDLTQQQRDLARDQAESGKIETVPDIWGGPPKFYRKGLSGVTELPPIGGAAPPNKNLTSGTITGVEYGPVVTDKGVRPAPQVAQVAQVMPPTANGPQKSPGQVLMEKYGGNPSDGKNWDFLATLPPQAQEGVYRLSTNDANPASYPARTMQGMGQSVRQAYTDAALKFDPTYNQQDFPIIRLNRQRFDTGKQGDTIRSFNVLAEHAGTMLKLGQALDNNDLRLFNQIAQTWARQTGNQAPTNFDTMKHILGTELIKALGVAGAGAEVERRTAIAIDNASSPNQLAGVINEVVRPAVRGQVLGLRSQFTSSTRRPEKEFNDKLSPAARELFDAPDGQAGGKQFQPPSNWKFSPSRKQYKDPSGKLYDIDGNPVNG